VVVISPLRSLLACVLTCLLALAVSMAPASGAMEQRRAPFTDLTLVMPSCEGCSVTLYSYNGVSEAPWESLPATVSGGRVTISVPSSETAGLSIQLKAPWEGLISYDTNVVFRYAGKSIGNRVTFKQARKKKSASGCWAGTVNDAVTLRVNTRAVNVRGVLGKARGTIAWVPRTESYLQPMARTYSGVLGSQDVMKCQTTSPRNGAKH